MAYSRLAATSEKKVTISSILYGGQMPSAAMLRTGPPWRIIRHANAHPVTIGHGRSDQLQQSDRLMTNLDPCLAMSGPLQMSNGRLAVVCWTQVHAAALLTSAHCLSLP